MISKCTTNPDNQNPDNFPSTEGGKFHFNKDQRRTMSSLLFAFFFDGLDTILFSLTLVLIMKDLSMSKEAAGLIATVFIFGQVAGGVTLGVVGDWLGRKRSLVLALVMYSVGTIACAFSPNVIWLAVFRAFTGFGGVGAQEPIACYISETVPPKFRSRYTSIVMFVFGIAGAVGALMVGLIAPDYGWRAVYLTAGALGLVGALPYVLYTLKETQSFLDVKKQKEEQTSKHKSLFDDVMDIFRDPKLRKNWLVGLCLPAAQQTMLWAFLTLVPAYVIAEKGYTVATGMSWFMTTALAGSCGFILYGFVADAIGRKWAFRIFAAFSGSFLPLTMLWSPSMTWFRVLSAIAICCIYALYTGIMTYLPELFPTRVRSSAVGITNNSGRIIAAFSPTVVSMIAVRQGTPFAVSLTAMSIVIVFIALHFGPETKGKTLEELTGEK